MEKFEIKRDAVQRTPESFRLLVDIDGQGCGLALTALNRKSIVALMQIVTIVNHPRVGGYVIRTESGQLVASVDAMDFIKSMTEATALRNPAPDAADDTKRGFWARLAALFNRGTPERGSMRLDPWDLVKVGTREPMNDPRAKAFVGEIVIDGAVEKVSLSAPTADSMIALLTAATCEKMPRIGGWNLYDEAGELLASVPAVAFLAMLAEKTSLGKTPADPKKAGWRAMPLVAPTSPDFERLIEKARQDGRLPQ